MGKAPSFSVPERYRLLEPLGEGRAGAAYLAEDLTSKRMVALKVVTAAGTADDTAGAMRREFAALRSFEHPALARVFAVGTTGEGVPYLVREYVPGERLRPGPPSPNDAPQSFLAPIRDVLSALALLHRSGLFHLDLHAGNVIERPDGRAILIDAGLGQLSVAGAAAHADSAESDGAAKAARLVKADVLAAGYLLVYRLTGRCERVLAFPQLGAWDNRLVVHLERIVGRALSEDPAGGFASAEEFLDALATVLGYAEGEAGRRRAFVGQTAALSAALRVASNVGDGRTSCLWVRGEPGAGKTSFLGEVRARAQLGGLATAEIRLFAAEPFAPIPFFRALAPGLSSRACRELAGMLRRSDGPSLEGASQAAAALLAAMRTPIVATIDDFHHADPPARRIVSALLDRCARRDRGLLGLVVASTETAPAAVPTATLGRLSRSDAACVLAALAAPVRLDPHSRRELLKAARGRPRVLTLLADRVRAARSRGGFTDEPSLGELCASADMLGDVGACTEEDDRRLLEILAILDRPATADEVAAAAGSSARVVTRRLRAMADLVAADGGAPPKRQAFCLASDSLRAEVLRTVSKTERRRLHGQVAHTLGLLARSSSSPWLTPETARHWALAGDLRRARALADAALDELAKAGQFERGIELIERILPGERRPKIRCGWARRLSAFASEAGQHRVAIDALQGALRVASPRERVHFFYRLGVHYQKLGDARKAFEHFALVGRAADPKVDLLELVQTDSELADLAISQGRFEEAEEACRRGLERARRITERSELGGRQAMMSLRAARGRLELRRMNLASAARELGEARKLAKALADDENLAAILNNLAVVHSLSNQFRRAQATFRGAERLARRLGTRESLFSIACNLAIVAAKLGECGEAREELRKAADMLPDIANDRLRFLCAQSETVVDLLLGDFEKAAAHAPEALAQGRRAGDRSNALFLEVYEAEALLETWRLREAGKILARLERQGDLQPILRRMVRVRAALHAALTGTVKKAQKLLGDVAKEPPTNVVYLEAWNACIAGRAAEAAGTDGRTALAIAREAFERLQLPFARASSMVALLRAAVVRRNERAIRPILREVEAIGKLEHRALAVEAPLVCAEACLVLGETARARDYLERARTAIVGRLLPSLDVRIELASAHLASAQGDVAGARHHLHRALGMRSHLAEQIPARCRPAFLRSPECASFGELERALGSSAPAPAPPASTEEDLGIVAKSPAMAAALRRVADVAPHELSVLIRGPTGAGKELIARTIHAASRRRGGPFVVIHCPSIAQELIESELFGHMRGAFTGAEEDRAGLLASAAGGTVLLDEIAGLSPEAQAKLLRVVETRSVRPLGGMDVLAVDVRFLSSTAENLTLLADQGLFRRDLYWRLAQAEIAVPPLAERTEDLPQLVRLLIEQHAARLGRPAPRVGEGALAVLAARRWPGNVRELDTMLLRALLACGVGSELRADTVKELFSSPMGPSFMAEEALKNDDLGFLRRQLEIAWLRRRFLGVGGDMSALAKKLGLSRPSLYEWFERLGVAPGRWRQDLERR